MICSFVDFINHLQLHIKYLYLFLSISCTNHLMTLTQQTTLHWGLESRTCLEYPSPSAP